MTDLDVLNMAHAEGFSASLISVEHVPVDAKFRVYCEENLCGNYGANYACPPDCGSVEEVRDRLMEQDCALVVQTVWNIGSYENKHAVLESKRTHNAAILRLTQKLRQSGLTGFCLGYGGCPLCDPCKRKENLPCIHPDQRIGCMSSYCIDVGKLAAECGLSFDWKQDTLYLFGMFVYKADEK